MKRFVYNEKYAKLLVTMTGETSQIDELAKRVNANAGHLRIVLDQWHKEGIIVKDKPGRDYHIKLTDKGEAISLKLGELMDLDNNWKDKSKQIGTVGSAPLESAIDPTLDLIPASEDPESKDTTKNKTKGGKKSESTTTKPTSTI